MSTSPSVTTHVFESPLGFVHVRGDAAGVSAISLTDMPSAEGPFSDPPEPVRLAVEQLKEYLAGSRREFSFLLNPAGTPFQQAVWRGLLEVPYGTSLSYLALTRRLGSEKAIRAVAAANGRNPLAIVVPCHRIIGSDGSLTGYAGGLWRKQWLLDHEGIPVGKAAPGQLRLF